MPACLVHDTAAPDAFAAVFGSRQGGAHWTGLDGDNHRYQWESLGSDPQQQSLGVFLDLLATCADDDRVLLIHSNDRRDQLLQPLSVTDTRALTGGPAPHLLLADVSADAKNSQSVARVRELLHGHDRSLVLKFKDGHTHCYWAAYQRLTNSNGEFALAFNLVY